MTVHAPPAAGARSARRRRLAGRDPATLIDTHGGHYGTQIVAEARRTGLRLPLACALVEQESSFRNIFGADAVRNPIPHHSAVTRTSYLRYRTWARQGLGRQGVGLTQLTWGGFQDEADHLGGCWKIEHQLHVGFRVLRDHIRQQGVRGGLAAYNAGNPASPQGLRYAAQVLAKLARWEKILAGTAGTAGAASPPSHKARVLRPGARGSDVAMLQRTLNSYLRRWGAPETLVVDGRFGPATTLAFRRVRLALGLAPAADRAGRVLVSPHDRIVMRHPDRRTKAERERAGARGRPYLRRLKARFKRESGASGKRPKIVRLALDFDQGRLARNVAIHTTVGHHSAGPVDHSDAEAVELCRRWHHMHRYENGWAGIGYHVCIARSGTIILLRPGWALGAGVEGHNTGTFHIVFNGDFRTDHPSREQIRSYRWFVAHGHEIHGIPRQGKRRLGHRDFEGHHSNACPGTNLHPYVKGT